KSTLQVKLRFAGLYVPTAGSVVMDGQAISDWTPAAIQRRVAVEFQDDVILHFTIAENIACTIPEKIDLDRVKRVLDEVGLVLLSLDFLKACRLLSAMNWLMMGFNCQA
ncbi:multidrug ABC transporter ATPase and permease, partial [Lacticaseibacillus rhamnosus MTCC 5462]